MNPPPPNPCTTCSVSYYACANLCTQRGHQCCAACWHPNPEENQ